MTRIRLHYADGSSETIEVHDYATNDGWLSYRASHGHKPVHIPARMISRVEVL